MKFNEDGVGAPEMLGPARLEPFARVLIDTSRDWIAAKRRSVTQSGARTSLGFECRLHDESGQQFAGLALPATRLLDIARFVESLIACLDAPIISICSEGLIYELPTADVIERFHAGDPSVEIALVVVVGERTTRRISSVQFPFVEEDERIQIVALRSGDRSIDVREMANRAEMDPVAGPLASAVAVGFAAAASLVVIESERDGGTRVAMVIEALRRFDAETGLGASITFRTVPRVGTATSDLRLLDAVFAADQL